MADKNKNSGFTIKLKHLLIVVFIFISAVPLFFSLQYLNQYAQNQYREQVGEKLEALSLIAKQRILTSVARLEDSAALIASRTQMRAYLAQWGQQQSPELLEQINKIIFDASAAVPHLHEISLYNNEGAPLTSTIEASLEEKLLSPPVKGTKVQAEPFENSLLLTAVTPLILDRKKVGYLKVAFFADFLLELIEERAGLGTTGEWLIVTRSAEGHALFVTPLKYDKNAAFTRIIDKAQIDIPTTQALLGNEILMDQAPDYMGQPVMAYTRYLPKQDWGLVVKMHESEIAQLTVEFKRVLLLLETVIIALAVIIGVIVSFYIAMPIERLRSFTQKVSSGDYSHNVEPSGWLEAKELTHSFNTMTKSLRDLNENLLKKVEERTQELDKANQRLLELANKDELTGVNNRRYFEERLGQEIKRAKRNGSSLALVMLDLDYFKVVNDTWGHLAGDQVLKTVSQKLQYCLRDTDIIARIGGEEFCLVMPDGSYDGVIAHLERIRIDIAALKIIYESHDISISCSMGLAFCRESDTIQSLMERADDALYLSKNAGRNKLSDENGVVQSVMASNTEAKKTGE
ncbi:diguanylate cyclase [Dasania sp. GY-MA-18]|uniref:diguanylate cyclase n=1 Tax=Dasania phycosphaerae TaxID=2950436 RepID=A0A9J6RMY4_9GAMM|nr:MULTISPECIES: diguanylate cyclase [Dasania]MCR8923282.1 diguanylate cyclase [Dasania sp. GY-MA-18]MCZ0865714.1 diguanylate cyclase [Dasania phycosphaerae]MCZ0869439.1 diguanylate cyclase [Dasania phycosphaerae]